MGETTVTGTILGVDNAPQVGVYVSFRLKSVGTDSAATSTIDQDSISVITDASGDFSTTLWDNGDSGIESIIEIRMPSGQRIDVIIPAGDATIDIWDLIENYQVGAADPQLPTNQLLFMRKDADLSDVASASTSRTNLGVEIGVDVEAFDATILKDADIGVTVQAQDDQLDDIAALTPTDGNFQVGNGTTWVAESGDTAQKSLGTMAALGQGQVGSGAIASGAGSTQIGTGTNSTANTIQFLNSGSVTATQFGFLATTLGDIGALAPSQFDVLEFDGSNWQVKDGDILESEIIVRSSADLPSVLDATKVYVLDGAIDVTGVTMEVPIGGASLRGSGSVNASMTSASASQTLFTSPVGGSGPLVIDGISFVISGTSSKVFNVAAQGTTDVFSVDRCAFVACTEIGTILDYGIIIVDTTQDVACGTGWTFDGSIIKLDLMNYTSTVMTSGGIVFKAGTGTGLSITNNCMIEACTIVIPSGVTLCDFAGSNISLDAGFEVLFNNISGAGTFFSVLDGDNVKCRWRDNNFDPAIAETNTYVGSSWHIPAAGEASTTIATAGLYVKVAGTTTYANEAWFSNTTNNAPVFDSDRTVKAIVQGSINFEADSGGANKDVTFTVRHWDDSASGGAGAFIDLVGNPRGTAVSGGVIRNASVLNYVTLDVNDRIELWVQNDTDTVNLTVKDGSALTITERAN